MPEISPVSSLVAEPSPAPSPAVSTASAKSLSMALAAAEAGDDRKAVDIVILDVADVAYLADYFIFMSGFSPVQVKAIANAIAAGLEVKFGRAPNRIEGVGEGRWVLLDYGDIVVHVFMQEEREYYNLEAFWGHGQRVQWPSPESNASPSSALG